MTHYSTITMRDATEELSPHRFYHGPLTVGTLAGFLTEFGDYKTALDAIVLGTLAKEKIVLDDTILSAAIPANNFAQRELKLLIRYTGDTSGKVYTLEIPTPDLSALELVGDFVNIADAGVMAAWVTEFEGIARTPDDDTETVTVVSAQVVGRNI